MHRFCDYCDVQKELDMDFDKVQKEKPEAEVPVIPVSLLVKWEVMTNGNTKYIWMLILLFCITH